ncbi:hypothetical protein AMS68_007940 [Peltaster fructicola]|uniref:Nudix hydrolase domain-containing protein n=1 Tax=Peltaster fructicola TaxID=286661 RepID=A0A6H0Y5Z9_9PEZI|nr:hypothetical protein AMS68_007940 [Peltaster fructicola]
MTSIDLVSALFKALRDITDQPYPVVTAKNTAKRASVALVVRINPSYAHWSEEEQNKPTSLEEFLERDWVQHGDPEVLFIKRAARKGDRWTSHIALPGGRRDPEDADDEAAAVRETSEEVGLDLEKYSLRCGNLPQRIVTTHWGKKPLLVLCPYVYILTTHNVPPLKLQPTEVASTHWVPVRSLLSEERRTVVFEDVSSRIANQETGVRKWMLSMILGKMMFAAINLAPTESLHSRESPAPQLQTQDNRYARNTAYFSLQALAKRAYTSDIFGQHPAHPPEVPLLLWGLTLGVIADFLDLLPPHNALTLWSYPTFTPLDVRLTIAVMTYRFKNRKRAELQAGTTLPGDPLDPDDKMRRAFGGVSESMVIVERPDETGFHGLGTGLGAGENKSKKAAVSTMLDGYYDIVRQAVATALVGRLGVATLVGVLAWRRWNDRL